MPATAGRVRMPANNRLSVSDSLRTSEIWQKSVGYDPYAPDSPAAAAGVGGGVDEVSGGINDRAKGLFALARLTGSSSAITPGGCKKCGQLGHLSFQCRNLLSITSKKSGGGLKGIQEKQEEEDEEDEELDEQARKKLFGVETDSSSSSSSDEEEDKRRRRKRKSSSSSSRKTLKKKSRKPKEKKSSSSSSSSSRCQQTSNSKRR
eukprot:GHVS01070213.1.p1 GENE.GHVS01070213.1~~GHVS01070213.1.p1  ORF type:complete len:205 (+),score=59.32 GHVS01070213.1:413-1027(+)